MTLLFQINHEIAKAVFHTTPPQILTPIVINHHAHLVYVEELIQPELTEEFRDQIRSNLFTTWLKKQIEQADIQVEI